jgi:hypothetical protein
MSRGQNYKKRRVSMVGHSENSGKTKARRGRGRPFPKGVSGNPGGRKPLPPEFKEALEELTPDALALLGKVVRDALDGGEVTSQAITAATYMINRQYGAPAQTATIRRDPEAPMDLHINLIPWAWRVPDGEDKP